MRFILALLLVLLFSLPAHADQLQDGKAASTRGDYPTAFKLLGPLADQGNAEAQLDLGMMYLDGQGAERNPTEAYAWIRKAAEQDNMAAQGVIGQAYVNGADGIKQDYAEGYFWLLLSTRDGARLSDSYYAGKAAAYLTAEQKAVADKRAEAWIKDHLPKLPKAPPGKSASVGRADDYTQESFCKLMQSAAAMSNAKGPVWVNILTRVDKVVVNCSTKIVDFQKSVRVNPDGLQVGWKQEMQDTWNKDYCGTNAEIGAAFADGWQINQTATFPNGEQFQVKAKCSYQSGGLGIPVDNAEAVRQFYIAAEHGNSDAQYHLGYSYEWGKGVQQDYEQAIIWYQKAADQGNTDAEIGLGRLYSSKAATNNAPEDMNVAIMWYQKAADQGNPDGIKLVEQARRDQQTIQKNLQAIQHPVKPGFVESTMTEIRQFFSR